MRHKLKYPTPEEDEAINRGIASDPDNPELTDADFKRMRPLGEVDPELYAAFMQRRVETKEAAKTRISLRLDQDVLERLRAGGRGWQDRANAVLRKAVLGE